MVAKSLVERSLGRLKWRRGRDSNPPVPLPAHLISSQAKYIGDCTPVTVHIWGDFCFQSLTILRGRFLVHHLVFPYSYLEGSDRDQ